MAAAEDRSSASGAGADQPGLELDSWGELVAAAQSYLVASEAFRDANEAVGGARQRLRIAFEAVGLPVRLS